MTVKNGKIFIVGDGAVGSSVAFSLLQSNVGNDVYINDIQTERVAGDVMDLEDALPYQNNRLVKQGSYSDAADAEIVVITAGASQKPGETRLDLVDRNLAIINEIVPQVVASGFEGIFLIISNPVDILSAAVQKISGFDPRRVIGSGTVLDTARLKIELSRLTQFNPGDIDAYMLGEHGDSEFANFDEVTIGATPLSKWITDAGQNADQLSELNQRVAKKGYEIFNRKGATYYGVAAAATRIIKAILNNEHAVLPVSVQIEGQYGVDGIYLGTPTVLGKAGAERVIETQLSANEIERMKNSGNILKELFEKSMSKYQ